MSAIISSSVSNPLAVQKICAIVICKPCAIGLPSQKSGINHLRDTHSFSNKTARILYLKAEEVLQELRLNPHPMREQYLSAPSVASSFASGIHLLPPLEGMAIVNGYQCPFCPSCYPSEKYIKAHIKKSHDSNPSVIDDIWIQCQQSGSIRLQTIYRGISTKYFPVSTAPPITMEEPDSEEQHSDMTGEQSLEALTPKKSSQLQESDPSDLVDALFAEFDHAFSDPTVKHTTIAPSRASVSSYLARTNYDKHLTDAGVSMKDAAFYSGLLGIRSPEEKIILQDVSDYLRSIPNLAADIAPTVLQAVNLRGNQKEFIPVSSRAAERYARSLARFVIAATRVKALDFIPDTLSTLIDNYHQALSSSPPAKKAVRKDLLHALLKSLCLRRLPLMESPKKLFVHHFIMFCSVVGWSRKQSDKLRFAEASDMSHTIAALLYGATSCAITEVHRLRETPHPSSSSSSHLSGSQNSTAPRQSILLHNKVQDILDSLKVDENTAASYIRKALDIAIGLSKKEDVSLNLDECSNHPFCVIVHGVHLQMTRFGNLVQTLQRELHATFKSLLYGCPMPENFLSRLSTIEDAVSEKTPGFSFLSHGSTKEWVRNNALWVFNTIIQTPKGRAEFIAPDSSPPSSSHVLHFFGHKLRRLAVQKWLSRAQDAIEKLLLCTHLSSGSPARGTEIEALQLCNTEHAVRNFYITQGRVTIVSRYSKTRSIAGWDRIVPRFPDPATSKAFLIYLTLFRPLECLFVNALHGSKHMKVHVESLFVENGIPYSAGRIRDIVRNFFHTKSLPIEFNHIRHFSVRMVPIVTRFFGLASQHGLSTEANEIGHLQAGHSAELAERVYARSATDIPSLPSSTVAKYRSFSFAWHRCMGLLQDADIQPQPPTAAAATITAAVPLQPLPSPSSSPLSINEQLVTSLRDGISKLSSAVSAIKRPIPPSMKDPHASRKRPHTDSFLSFQPPSTQSTIPFATLYLPPPFHAEDNLTSLLPSLKAMLKRPDAMFRSEIQLMVTDAVMSARNDILVLMPTGSGKTICALLPIFLEGSSACTVVIVPLAVLIPEYVQRCCDVGIKAGTWANRDEPLQVYVISADHNLQELQLFLRNLINKCQLRRIIFDEAHLLILWDHFRASLRRLRFLVQSRGPNVQIVLLTATLPPFERQRLLFNLNLPSAILYAQPTVRNNLKFSVIDTSPICQQGRFTSPRDSMASVLRDKVVNAAVYLHANDGGRIVIFTLYRADTDFLQSSIQQALPQNLQDPAHAIPVRTYHSGMSTAVLEETYIFWKTNTFKVSIIICTSAFGTGLDIANVRYIFHFGGSNSLLEYAQEAGRGGRDGDFCECIILYNKNLAERHSSIVSRSSQDVSFESVQETENKIEQWRLMLNWITQKTSCRKNSLYTAIDGISPGMCLFNDDSLNCDFCQLYKADTSSSSHLLTDTSQHISLPSHPSPLPVQSPRISPPQPFTPSQTPVNTPPNNLRALPVRRILTYSSPSQQTPNLLADFRSIMREMENYCIVCLVLHKNCQLREHPCRDMKNRCKRCFHTGHEVRNCKTFNPRRENFCYTCSLSQIQGSNVHRDGEFGKNCFMACARNLAWMLWANGPETQQHLSNELFKPLEKEQFTRSNQLQDPSANTTFFATWIRTSWSGLPNLVHLTLWWWNQNKQSTQSS